MSRPSLVDEHEAQILAILNATDKEMSVKQMVRSMPVEVQRMWDLLRPMVENQTVHIARRHGSRLFYRPGPGATGPSLDARILAVLAEEPLTCQQIADKLGNCKAQVNFVINTVLRAPGQPKQVYIRQYLKVGRGRPVLYAVGNRPDANRPKPLSVAEKNRRHRVRVRADADRLEVVKKKDMARKMKPKRDAFLAQFAGLFGQRLAA